MIRVLVRTFELVGPFAERHNFKSRFSRFLDEAKKSLKLLSFPLPGTVLVCVGWINLIYKNNIHIENRAVEIYITAWIPWLCIAYSIITGIVVGIVTGQYLEMRFAIKDYKIKKFMRLRDEDLSPVFHVVMWILAWAVLGMAMFLPYPSMISGLPGIAVASYVFGLFYFVILEIDDPLKGVWVIRNVHKEWLDTDPKLWRANEHEKLRKEMQADLDQCRRKSQASIRSV